MIKIIAKQDDSIKYFTNGGRSNYYLINTEYLRDMAKQNISLIKLEFNLISRSLVITDMSLFKLVLFLGAVGTFCILLCNGYPFDGYATLYQVIGMVLLISFVSLYALILLFIISCISNLSTLIRNFISLIRFNIRK